MRHTSGSYHSAVVVACAVIIVLCAVAYSARLLHPESNIGIPLGSGRALTIQVWDWGKAPTPIGSGRTSAPTGAGGSPVVTIWYLDTPAAVVQRIVFLPLLAWPLVAVAGSALITGMVALTMRKTHASDAAAHSRNS